MNLSILFAAIMMVESGGDVNAVGDGGTAIGPLQIRPIMVAEANRLAGRQRFSLNDRRTVQGSRAIFMVVMEGRKPKTIRAACKIWNGAAMPESYYRKVLAELKKSEKK